MRYVILFTAGLVGLAGAAQAQVAAPRLNPAAIESFIVTPNRLNKPFNPAVLPWSGSSRIGAALTDLEAVDTIGGVSTLGAEGDGKMVHGRFVGENFAIAGEVYQMDLGFQGSSADFEGAMIAAALQFGGVVAVGASRQNAEFIDPTSTSSETLTLIGATLRIGEAFYFGAASGDETFEQGGGEADRSVSQFGVAYHTRDGESGVHLEVFRQMVDLIDDPVAGITEDEVESDAFTVEFIFSNILLGLEAIMSEATDNAGVLQEETDLITVSLGWAPEEGLSIVASLMNEEQMDVTTGDITDIDTVIVAAAWSY